MSDSDNDYSGYELLGPEYEVIPICTACLKPLGENYLYVEAGNGEYDAWFHVACASEQHPN